MIGTYAALAICARARTQNVDKQAEDRKPKGNCGETKRTPSISGLAALNPAG